MNYYKRHIGDYLKDTAHLSLLEHGIYTRLLDVYYTREAAIPAAQAARLIGARTPEESEALELVLEEFFVLEDGMWKQSRCEAELADKEAKAETNRVNGKRGGRPKKETQSVFNENPDGYLSETQTEPTENPSHKPLTNNQENTYTASSAEEADPVTAGKSKSTAKTFKSWIDSLPADEFAISPEDPIYADTAKSGIRDEFVMLCWAEFKERHTTGERKSTRQKDWRATFRNAVRDNWYKFWAVNGAGECFLTSQGKFAARRHGYEVAA